MQEMRGLLEMSLTSLIAYNSIPAQEPASPWSADEPQITSCKQHNDTRKPENHRPNGMAAYCRAQEEEGTSSLVSGRSE